MRKLGLGGRLALLMAVMLSLYAATAPLAFWRSGAVGVLASAMAAAVCLIGALGALIASDHFRGPSRALHRLAWSMALRTGLPLLLAIALLRFQDGALFKAGGVHYLLVFYFVALAVETPLSLPGTEANPPQPTGQALRSVRATRGDCACSPGGNPHDTTS